MSIQTDILKKYAIVSLDIFDTALLRTVLQPSDIFLIVGQRAAALLGDVSPERFKDLRVEAERRSRPRNARGARHEATLAEIYDCLAEVAHLAPEAVLQLRETEMAVEVEYTQPNAEILSVYRECLARGQRVIFISDMYLPAEALSKMLRDSGYTGFERVFVSCEFGRTKRSGKLYPRVMAEIGARPEQIVHIGDSLRADVRGAQQNGIQAVHYHAPVDAALRHLPHLPRMKESLGGSLMGALVVNRRHAQRDGAELNETNFWEHFGYAYVGPLYYGFVAWLIERIRQDGIDRIHFMAREGHIMQQVYERFEARQPLNLPHHYLFASRRLFGLALNTGLDEQALHTLIKRDLNASVGAFLRSNGLDPARYADVLHEHGFNGPDDRLRPGADLDRLKKLLLAVQDDFLAYSASERDTLLDYLKRVGFAQGERLALIDVGWHGTMQKALSRLCQKFGLSADLQGYYLGAFPQQAVKPNDMRGYLIEKGQPEKQLHGLWEGVYLFEFIFSGPHTSIVGLKREGDQILPLHRDEPENDYHARAVPAMQHAALAFVDDMLDIHGIVSVSPEAVFTIFERLLFKPTRLEAQMLGDLSHTESQYGIYETSHIARPTIRTHNPLRFLQLFREYRASHWKVGYLKRSSVNPVYKQALSLIRNGHRLVDRIRT